MRLTVISDTHDLHEKITIQKTDVLIHCGDATNYGHTQDIKRFLRWFAEQPTRYRIYVPGNHDFATQRETSKWIEEAKRLNIDLLADRAITIEGRVFYGTPWSPTYGNWAWMAYETSLSYRYLEIPDTTEFLISHTPPRDCVDLVDRGERVGSIALKDRILTLPSLKYVFCGHIHEAAGAAFIGDIGVYNCTMVNRSHRIVYQPRVFDV